MYTNILNGSEIDYTDKEIKSSFVKDGEHSPIIEELNCVFPTRVLGNTFVIYYIRQDKNSSKYVILGYLVTDRDNITSSSQYEALCLNTYKITGVDVTSQLKEMECLHINEWQFDNSLNNQSKLQNVFGQLFNSLPLNGDIMIWCEGSEIIFHPLYIQDVLFGHNAAISYFTQNFMNL